MPVLPHPHATVHISHSTNNDDHNTHSRLRRSGEAADINDEEREESTLSPSSAQLNLPTSIQAPLQPISTSQSKSEQIPPSSPSRLDLLARKSKQSSTARVFAPSTRSGRSWRPGQEPGFDPNEEHPEKVPISLKEECDILMVDFGRGDMRPRSLSNDTLEAALEETRPEGLGCRWISINGLSWDIISLLGRKMNFHRLAIEDLIQRRSRTKVDWYSNHVYVSLAMQKLVHTDPSKDNTQKDPENGFLAENDMLPIQNQGIGAKLRRLFKRKEVNGQGIIPQYAYSSDASLHSKSKATRLPPEEISDLPPAIRTLQRYHGGQNEERTRFMEEQSPLRKQHLAVAVEQVAMFLTADNTIVTFFEQSAGDVEDPILTRLESADTVLRRTSEASMVLQAVIDAIVDLAIPVTLSYKGVIDELELNVLTGKTVPNVILNTFYLQASEPDIKHAKALYIINAEITDFRNSVSPTQQLLSTLRDHKGESAYTKTPAPPPNDTTHDTNFKHETIPHKKPFIAPSTNAYFGDVEDHVLLIQDNIDQQRRAVDSMIDLIFNTIAAYQNESMKQLTVVTILFLPLSFLTGYFGMNFTDFNSIYNPETYFWKIALPLMVVVSLALLRDEIYRWFMSTKQRRGIRIRRAKRLDKAKSA